MAPHAAGDVAHGFAVAEQRLVVVDQLCVGTRFLDELDLHQSLLGTLSSLRGDGGLASKVGWLVPRNGE